MPERKNDGILSLNVKKVTNLALSLENKSDITVQEFNSCAYLERKFT